MEKQTVNDTMDWEGTSGKLYKYGIYTIGTELKAEAGNYIFAKKRPIGERAPLSREEWTPLYIGETEDLSTRFGNHHKKACTRKYGATHIYAHHNSSAPVRLAEEADLIEQWDPICNGEV